MDNIFGIPMNTILIVLAAIVFICVLGVALIAIFNPIAFKMALRNPPRRKAQSTLIVIGLMLATLIISSALTTGDTLDYSLKKISYESLGPIDQTIAFVGDAGGRGTLSVNNEPIPETMAEDLANQFAGDPDISAFLPILTVDVPVINYDQRLSEPSAILTGQDWEQIEQVGGISSAGGGKVDLESIPPGSAILSKTLAEDTQSEPGDTLTIFINNEPIEVLVHAIGEDSLLTGLSFSDLGPTSHGLAMSLDEVQEMTGLQGQVRYIAVVDSAPADSVSLSSTVEDKLEEALDDQPFGVNPVKRLSVQAAELAGNQFMSFFIVLGLFSIAAGVLLIFLIFMMLASERRPEMGMARAVGMRQSQLVQQFLAEGTAYDLLSALVGAAAGVLIAFAMVSIMSEIIGEFFTIEPAWTFRSLAVAYTLGVTVTFITVIFASARAAKLNIVSAIRDLPEPERDRSGRPPFRLWHKIPRFGPRLPGIGMYLISLVWFPLELLPNLLIYPFRLAIWIVRVAAYYIGWGPLLIPVGLLLMLWGYLRNGETWSLALYSIGLSLLAIGAMLILTRYLPDRIVYSAISVLLLLWWLAPEDSILSDIFSVITPGDLQGDFEMFFISGVMMVAFATLLVVWNAEVIVWLAMLLGRLFARWVPAVKTAIAYPLASKTKTGLTLAMFSLIVFSLVFISTLSANFVELFTTEEATGDWDVRVITSTANPVDDLVGALEGSDVNTSEFQAIGNVSSIVADNSQIRLPEESEWQRAPLNGVDADYARNTVMPFKIRATGYETDQQIWEAIATDPTVAVIDAFSVGPGGFGTPEEMFRLEDVDTAATTMEPTEVVIGALGSGEERTVRVIGVIDDEISTAFGLFMNQQLIQDLYGSPDTQQIYIQLGEDSYSHAQAVSRQIEAALLEYGVQAESTEEQLRVQARIQTGFLDLLQGFMGLGLLVGIAALGVISFRAVVERRQQIGMLRAIGFQRNMVAASFLLESLVVAFLGVVTGVVLALILSRNLVTSNEIGAEFETFVIPWGQIALLIGIALIAATLMTLIPSRNAASIPVAEALRYE